MSYAVSLVHGLWRTRIVRQGNPRARAAAVNGGITAYVALVVVGCGEQAQETLAVAQSAISEPTDVWTQHYDNARTGAILSEVTLNTSNVATSSFGKLFTRAVDGPIYAQPLYRANVALGGTTRNLVYVASVEGTLYAFDADETSATEPLLSRNLLDVAAPGSRPVRNTDVGQVCKPYLDFTGNLAIVGTPVIDVVNNTLYVVSRVREPSTFVQRLHALDTSTLTERPNSPVVIQAQVRGTGAGSLGGAITFDSEIHNQRAALLLDAGNVYIAWASHCDTGPYHGWIIGYDTVTLRQSFVFNSTVDGALGGIWQAGQGLSADAAQQIYFLTGNGTSNAQFGSRSFGSAFVRLDPRLTEPVVDWFMPYNVDFLNDNDADLGSSGALLIPGTNLLLGGGKEGKFYLVDRNDLGHFRPDSNSQIVQSFQATAGHIHGSPVYWHGDSIGPTVYVWSESDYLKAFSFNGRQFNTTPTTSSMRVPDGMPGGMLSISANAGSAGSGIVWASHPTRGDANHATRQGTLRAFDATDISRELWNSDMNFERDHVGNFAKFVTPVVANGKVYLSTFSDELAVYGLLPSGGTGLLAEYFADINLSRSSFVRIDRSVNFDWRDQSPARSLNADNFSVRWLGAVLPQFSEEYTFITSSDDGVRLWIDGSLVIDDWTDHAQREVRGTVRLLAGRKYDVRMEFYERSGDAVVQLAWSSPSQPTAVIPNTQLFPAAGPGIGLSAQYFDTLDFTGPARQRVDASISFEWGGGSPDPAVASDTFSVRWTGELLARSTETYQFRTTSDDGVRLWIGGALLIDNWTDHPRTEETAELALVEGTRYPVRLDYYERGGDAVALLAWSSASQPWEIVPRSQLFPTISAGTGLFAEYFDNADFTQTRFSRIDPTVSFDWGTGAPDPAMSPDTFSVRWSGQIKPKFTETYTFVTESDDGVRLWVNGMLLVDHTSDHSRTRDIGFVGLKAGRKHDIVMEFNESFGAATAKLFWSSASQPEELIPSSQLYAVASMTP